MRKAPPELWLTVLGVTLLSLGIAIGFLDESLADGAAWLVTAGLPALLLAGVIFVGRDGGVAKERERLEEALREAAGPALASKPPQPADPSGALGDISSITGAWKSITGDSITGYDRTEEAVIRYPTGAREPGKTSDRCAAGATSLDDVALEQSLRQERLLVDAYAHALAQSRLNELMALLMSALGLLLLFTGAGLALWRSTNGGEVTASIVQTLAGMVVAVISHLFGRRATHALRHLSPDPPNELL